MQPRPELVADVVASLAHDLTVTLGWSDAFAWDAVIHAAQMEGGSYDERTSDDTIPLGDDDFKVAVVNYVQDWVIAAFDDKTWPACPTHPNHPLVMDDGPVWRCPRTRTEIARLGGLKAAG